jgi:hypothetical protein
MRAIGNHVLNAGAALRPKTVWYGTNEYNFEKLPDPPAYEPTECSQCATVIVLSEDEYSKLGKDYFCSDCTDKRIMQRAERTRK